MAKSKQIKITCKGQKYLPIQDLQNFQGKLKKLDDKEFQKLKHSLLKYGFSFPVLIWNNSILDGHQRIYVANALIKNGYEIGEIPCVEIEAKDEKEAAEKLLLINSQYAKMTKDGLSDFIDNYDIDIKDISDGLSFDIDIDKFMNDNFDNDDFLPDDDIGDIQYQIVIECEDEDQQTELLERFEKEDIKCRPLIL